MFEPLPQNFSFPEAEQRVLEFWERHNIFRQSLENRRGKPRFVFYEGPPTANGMPHPGHCLTRAIKDLFPRYQTMCGKLVERKAGWDTHGLPVEVEVCKELGIHTKEEIEAYGVEKFNRKCIESVFRYTREWEYLTKRLGFWVNLEEAYATFHQQYVESVWWSLKTLFERGLLYQGHKVVWWWAQGGTALSAGEVGEGYRTVQDPSVYVRFPCNHSKLVLPSGLVGPKTVEERAAHAWRLVERAEETAALLRGKPDGDVGLDYRLALNLLANLRIFLIEAEPDGSPSEERTLAALRNRGREVVEKLVYPTSLLVWTTTPWTLVSNHFAAVHPDVEYALVHDSAMRENYIIAVPLVEDVAKRLKRDLSVIATCAGRKLAEGETYVPPYPDAFYNKNRSAMPAVGWRIVTADFVTVDTGTGIVHVAPAFGEVDFNLLQDERQRAASTNSAIPLFNAVLPNGTFGPDAPEAYRGRWVKDCDKEIIRELRERGVLLHQETIEHEYPFCPRSPDDALIQYARQSWFVRTSQFRDEFLANNARIKWLPDHIQEGRFGDFLRNNVDWALSRERYWGTPLPIWVCEETGKMEAIGSLAELMAKPGATDATSEYPNGMWATKKREDPTLPDHLRVHKPYIDAWTYDSPFAEEGTEARRHEGTKGTGNREQETEKPRMRRVTEVIDCWWDAGSMPFAQWGFPHAPGSDETFTQRFPADFISEAIDQTRGWFYGLLSISTLLFGPGARAGSIAVPAVRNESGAIAVPAVRNESGSIAVPAVRPANNKPAVSADLSRRRRVLPHWEAGGSTYFLTFRVLAGELAPEERTIVMNACRHWDEQRALVHAVVVMPDHAHVLMTPLEKSAGEWWSLAELMHSIKGFAAHEINARRGATGDVWQREYFDRIIRGESDFDEKLNYIITNPAKRGMPEEYAWVWVEPTHAGSHRRDGDAPQWTPGTETHGSHRRDGDAPRSEYPHPYRTCIVLGHMMGEDGNKMSKRLRNYKEPNFVFDNYGADAMRWYFFSAQVPWTSTRFVEASIRDAQREFLVRLYNVFSFFNIYANIDGFIAHPSLGSPWRPTRERGELDRWIISELMRTIAFVREKMDAFENYPAAGRINEFVDALSNWYVRRSRDRFWKGEKDQDKWDAYHTLYGVLLNLSVLIAPFTPFFAEYMYQNLRGAEAQRQEGAKEGECTEPSLCASVPSCLRALSVHLCDYPKADAALIDEQLATEMDIVRDIVSLGRAARTSAKLKVRQPLGLCEIVLAKREHAAWLEDHRALIAEELNIRQVEFSTEADHYVSYQIKADFKAIGPKFGKLAPQVGAAVQKLDPAEARKSLESSGSITVYVGDEAVRLTSAEVQVQLAARPGWSAAQGRAGVVVVKTELTPDLVDEGVARELIHHVQALRKDQNLPYEARVTLTIDTADDELKRIAGKFAATIQSECLAETLEFGPVAGGEPLKIEGRVARLAIAARGSAQT